MRILVLTLMMSFLSHSAFGAAEGGAGAGAGAGASEDKVPYTLWIDLDLYYLNLDSKTLG